MLESSTSQFVNSSTTLLEGFSPPINQKQEQILQGAMQIFLKSGYAETSMDRVAAEAGVAKQTIYSHFQDKEGLFKALMERVTINRFQTLFMDKGQLSEEAFEQQLAREPAIVLRQVAETFLTLKSDQEYTSLLRIIIAESARFPELAKLYTRSVIQRGRQLLCRYFDAHPELDIKDSEAMAQIFIGSLVSYILAQEILHGKETIPLASDRLVSSLVNLVVSQIKPDEER
ncbi:TetR/AcrR family transcriptional regulator [Kovacikia minuta CCNUW1]|uniref:TetR/AcrR family transcriptional regulator n=1 Tax=Kovacikia minuta TaxID=2931930 RepID=UPI001CCBFDC1|nr:TetR/AcrR family transcriptional regulator [Kovacikia minuta]UBF24069.1 TetR/AcrR family transcriptional regulator [Kovacikia minuta CCNUW1]